MAFITNKLAYGNCKPLPLNGFPNGKAKIKIREKDWVYVYIRNESGITKFVVEEKDGHWTPYCAVEMNKREELK